MTSHAHSARSRARLLRNSSLASAFALGLLGTACGNDGNANNNTDANASNAAGAAGETGAQPSDGADGKDGANGVDGKDGADGENGAEGTNGVDGVDGTDGADGVDGVDGTNGTTPGPVAIFGSTPKKKIVTTTKPAFTFGCSAGDCEFQCSVDGAAFAACTSPLTLSGLAAADHQLKVKAKSADPEDTLGFGAAVSYGWTSRKPNIVAIIADDLGFSDVGALGSEIDTPNLDALATQGRILTNHHVGTVCAITRAMLMSGTDHHRAGEGTMGAPNDERAGLPGYEGYLNDRALSVAQLLKDGGYHTYLAGKWHLGSRTPTGTTGSGKTPDQWGFERTFALLGGAAGNHFTHESPTSQAYSKDGVYSHPGQPGEPNGFSTEVYTDQLIENIDANLADNKPFFAYAAYTAPHWPLEAPEPWLSKYKGKYDAGYGPIAEARLRRLKDRGILPQSLTPSLGVPETLTRSPATAADGTPEAKYISAVHAPADGYVDYGQGPVVKKWQSLTDLEKKAQARYMEIYAAMVDHLDYNIGRLIQHLKDIGEYEYTFIIFHSDSGAESWPINAGADPLATDESNASDAIYPTLGQDNGTASARNIKYGIRWAEVSNTPISQFKGFQGAGGLTAPAIVHLPGQTEALPPIHHFTHVTDDTATFLELAGVTPPTVPAPPLLDPNTGVDKNAGKVVYDGRYVYPVTGLSFLSTVQAEAPARLHTTAFGGEAYGRAFILSADGKWRARWTEPPFGPLDGHWQLFAIERDRAETNDLSAQNPDVVTNLVAEWKTYLSSVGGVEPLRPRGYY